MDFLEQVQEEEKFKKGIKLFKYLFIVVIALTIILSIVFTIKKQNDKKIKLITEQISDLIAESKLDENLLDSSAAKYNNKSAQKTLFVYKLMKINSSLAKENTKANRDSLHNLIKNTQANNESIFLNLAKIIWMTKALDSYKTNLTEEEKIFFKSHDQNFINEDEPFFFRVKILSAMFYLYNGDINASKANLKIILSSSKAQSSIKEEARALLSTI